MRVAPLSNLGLKPGRLNPLIWLTAATLSFLPAAYFFRDTCLVYVLVGLPVLAFAITLGIAWCWAIWFPDRLFSEDFEAMLKLLAHMVQTEKGPIPAGDLTANPSRPQDGGPSVRENG